MLLIELLTSFIIFGKGLYESGKECKILFIFKVHRSATGHAFHRFLA